METLIITTNEMKFELLKRNSGLLENIKYMTFKEFKENLYFSYDKEAIYEVMKQEKVSYEIASIYLSNLYYLEGSSKKINKLKGIYNYLNDLGLLKFNFLFRNYLKSVKIIVNGIENFSKEEEILLSGMDYEIQTSKSFDCELVLYEADTLEEEVKNLGVNIVNLIRKGIKARNIRLVNLNDDYRSVIEKVFSWYNIPNNIHIEKSIGSVHLVKEFLDSESIEKGINKISEMVNSSSDEEIYNKIIEISSKYVLLPNDSITKEMMKEELKRTNIKGEILENAVEEGNINTIYDENVYIFVVGFNEGVLPKIYKDEDYLSDKEKELIKVDTSIDKNVLEKKKLEFFIRHNKNVILSYKNKTLNETFYPSSFLESIKVRREKVIDDYTYSDVANKIALASMLDDMYKYNVINGDLSLLKSNYPDIPYNTYSNKFSGISKSDLSDFLDKGLSLSYTSIDSYNRCSFRYYLQYVLKIDKFESSFMTYVGELFHYILSKSFLSDFDLEKEWNNFVENNRKIESSKEEFFLSKLKKEIISIIDEINRQNSYSCFDECLYEQKLSIPICDKVNFVGIIDKIMFKRDEKLLSVIDYKTGTPSLSLKYLPYGIDMQLPVYLYLIRKYDEFKDYKVVGFYLQKLIHSEVLKNDKKSYERLKRDNLKLQGYSLGDVSLLEKFDKSYIDSEIIKSMKVSSKGFYQYSKVLNEEEINSILSLVDENIMKSVESIKNGEFSINPKRTFKENVGCAFCEFQDVCYHTERDYVDIEEKKLDEVLGGTK